MREIKFREWNGLRMDYNPPVSLIASTSINDRFEDSIMMQYTGLKDKHGKDIYEGDIMRVPCLYEHGVYDIAKVEWVDSLFMASATTSHTRPLSYNEYLYDIHEDSEIIGNVHQNPELLT